MFVSLQQIKMVEMLTRKHLISLALGTNLSAFYSKIWYLKFLSQNCLHSPVETHSPSANPEHSYRYFDLIKQQFINEASYMS